MRYTIATYGPCCRCGQMARHILIVGGRRVVVHDNPAITPCPVRPGEMLEAGEPKEVTT
jgi:hypothetical protein